MSGMLRLGGNILNIEKAFQGIGGCNSFVYQRTKGSKLSNGGSCGSAILNEIKVFLKEMQNQPSIDNNIIENNKKEEIPKFSLEELEYKEENGDVEFAKHFNKCPLCGSSILHSGGCISCECGWSKCD